MMYRVPNTSIAFSIENILRVSYYYTEEKKRGVKRRDYVLRIQYKDTTETLFINIAAQDDNEADEIVANLVERVNDLHRPS